MFTFCSAELRPDSGKMEQRNAVLHLLRVCKSGKVLEKFKGCLREPGAMVNNVGKGCEEV
jgi:hypothetical protein